MQSCAFVFPGQGSQFVGMGADLARECPESRRVFEVADDCLGFSLSRLCWEGPQETLRQTEFTQPAVVAVSLAVYKALEARGLTPSIVAGHSVGEYAALAATGALSMEDCFRLVRRRGQLMQQAGDERNGGMAAVFGLGVDLCETLCRRVAERGLGIVEIANINSPEQIVISGDKAAIEAGNDLAREMGARRYVPLEVSAAFHSSLMKGASDRLAEELDRVQIREARFPVVVNVSARAVTAPEEIRRALREQVASRVLWVASIETMLARDTSLFVEAGPGTALAGMIRKIRRDLKVFNVQDPTTLQKTLDQMTVSVAG